MIKEQAPTRRDFLKSAFFLTAGIIVPKDLIKLPDSEPLVNLPVLHTKNTPLYVEQLTRGGNPIGHIYPGEERYAPVWLKVSDLAFDILTPIRPDPSLEVPLEFNPLDKVPWVADLPHVTGLQPTVLKAVIGYGDLISPKYGVGALESKAGSEIVAAYAFTDRTRIYPAKIYNILTALASISAWMKDNGPMRPGKVYSYLEMAGPAFRNRDEYITRGILDAGGICASVTTTSKVNYLASRLGLTENVRRYLHEPNIQYAENPFDPGVTKENSDATVGFVPGRPDTYGDNADYQFKLTPQSPPLYLAYRAQLRMDSQPINGGVPSRHVIQPADARLTFTASLTKSKPDYDKDIGELLALREEYARFHNFGDGLPGSLTEP